MTGFRLEPMKAASRRELLRGPQIRTQLERIAANIARTAGEGHATDSQVNRSRARTSIRTVTRPAIYREARSKNLSQALASARTGMT